MPLLMLEAVQDFPHHVQLGLELPAGLVVPVTETSTQLEIGDGSVPRLKNHITLIVEQPHPRMVNSFHETVAAFEGSKDSLEVFLAICTHRAEKIPDLVLEIQAQRTGVRTFKPAPESMGTKLRCAKPSRATYRKPHTTYIYAYMYTYDKT